MIITVYGARPGLGSTFTAINIATLIAKKHSTVLADMNLRIPDIKKYLAIDDTHSIDNLMSLYDANILNTETISNNLIKIKNTKAQILGGTYFPDKAEYMRLETIEAILDGLNTLSEVVICDTHSELDNAATVACLRQADVILTIVNQNPLILEETEEKLSVIKNIQGLNTKDIYGIINRYSNEIEADAISIKDLYSIKMLATLRDVGPGSVNSIINKKPYVLEGLFKGKEKQLYISELETIIDYLLRDMQEKTA